jgi:hypothetical protein
MPIIQGKITGTNATSVLTIGGNEPIEIFQIELHSTHDQAQTVQLYFVPASNGNVGTAGLGNEKESLSLAAGQSIAFVAPKVPWKFTEENYTIQIKSSVANVLNYWIATAEDGIL